MKQHMCIYIIIYIIYIIICIIYIIIYYIHVQYIHIHIELQWLVKLSVAMGIPGKVSLAQFMCSIYDFDGEWTVAGIVVAFNFHWMLHGLNTLHIWFLVWNIFYCSIYWECHHPN